MSLMGLEAWGGRWKRKGRKGVVSCEALIAALRKHGTYSGAGREVGMKYPAVYAAFNPSKSTPIPRCNAYAEEARSIARGARVSCEELIAALRKHGTYSGAGREVGMANNNVYTAFNPSKKQPTPRCHKYTEEARAIASSTPTPHRSSKHPCEEVVRAVMVHKKLNRAGKELGYSSTAMSQIFFGRPGAPARCPEYARLVRYIVGPQWVREELMR